MPVVAFITWLLAVLTVVAQLAVLDVAVSLVAGKQKGVIGLSRKHALALAFAVALVATAGSLFYSEIAGYDPCDLCWYQRIFMYPLVLLLGWAVWKNDRAVSPYALLLAAPGGLVAAYHYLGQLGMMGNLPCPVVGYSESCAKVFFMQFGYITFPLMALTAFAAIGLLAYLNLQNKNN